MRAPLPLLLLLLLLLLLRLLLLLLLLRLLLLLLLHHCILGGSHVCASCSRLGSMWADLQVCVSC